MERSRIKKHRIYATGTRQTYQTPALTVDTDLWTWKPRTEQLRRALPRERTGRHLHPEGHRTDTGVLVLRALQESTPVQQTLESLQFWQGKLNEYPLCEPGQTTALQEEVQRHGLTLRVGLPRNILMLWDEHLVRTEERDRFWSELKQRALAEKQRREEELVLLQRRTAERGNPHLVIRPKKIGPPSLNIWGPTEVVLPIREFLRLLDPNEGKQSVSPRKRT